jgi:hypothetical protein
MAKVGKAVRKKIERRAGEIARSLKSFAASEAVFSSDAPPLVDKYENTWVGVYEGKIAASGKTLQSLKRSLSAKGIPLSETMVRRIDRTEKTFIF